MSTTTKGIALITGASAGIGAVYADRLAKRGYDLILVARNKTRLAVLAQRLRRSTGRSVETVAADLNDKADLARVEAILRANPRITLLVNNAGVASTAPLLDADVEKMDEMIRLNVGALTRLTYAAVPGFVTRGEGTIINISSIVAISPEALNGVYGGSKAFVLAFSFSLQHELADKGVRIQAVLPGATATELWDRAGKPLHQLPAAIVMSADDMVDAALAGLDQGEVVTIPALRDNADWDRYEAARRAMFGKLSSAIPAPRYTAKANGKTAKAAAAVAAPRA
jgi:short-subunit dehydrogenase